ncbi:MULTISPECIES: hypothetical protein [Listeria]|uniref:hypothetical protein n=1 Tax=Listeria TaxID=1637 RepID=UPI0016245C35|nr:MULTISPECIES: hypothetical protein [Listeria]MBC1814297.1 hypothetical protein [Listeria booriae]MBC1817189.1 hypothetical protein [Listeria seeligeri]
MEILKKHKKAMLLMVTLATFSIVFFLWPHAAYAANEFESKINTGTADISNLVKRIAPGILAAVIAIAALLLLGPRKIKEWAQDHIFMVIASAFLLCAGSALIAYLFDLFGG